MSLEKFRALLEKPSFDRTESDVTEMENLIKNKDIEFTQYFNNDQGQDMQTTQYNNNGRFLRFVIATQYPNGELMVVQTPDKGNVFVPSSYVEF